MRLLRTSLVLCCLGQSLPCQDAVENPRIDPLALRVLRATMDSLKNAKALSFRAVVSRESLGSNNEILTFYARNEVTLSRPNKLRVHVDAEHQGLDLYYNQGDTYIFSPGTKFYAQIPASPDLDKVVDRLEERNIQLPLAPLLRGDPYPTLIDGLESAAVIGRVDISGKTYHHLVFTEKEADWQMWVEAGEKPTPRRVQIVYKTLPREPRISVDFLDWNLAASPPADFFIFSKPEGAKLISFLDANEANRK